MEDIQILADHDVTRLYFISSELNSEGNEFILELADRIQSFNETRAEDQKVTWFGANYLLKFSADEYERLYQGGFTEGWYDITALDDENARAMRTPYRNDRLLAHLKTYAESTKKQLDLRRTHQALGINTGVSAGDGRDDELIRWSMFLGNSATTIETIRHTIQFANQEGLSTLFDACWIVGCTRVFDYEEPDEATLAVTYSVSEDLKRTGSNQLLPSFAYPPALLREFSEKEIAEMFEYIAKTHLSKCYQRTRDWCGFVRQNATAESVARWMAELSDTKGIRIPDQTSAAATLQNIFLKEAREEEKSDDGDPAKQPIIISYYSEHKADGFSVIAVEAGDTGDLVSQFAQSLGMNFSVWLDPDQASLRAIGNATLPNSYVIDRAGTVRLMWTGEVRMAMLEEYVTPLIAEDH